MGIPELWISFLSKLSPRVKQVPAFQPFGSDLIAVVFARRMLKRSTAKRVF